MKRTINAYFSIFLITLISSAATLFIVDVGTTNAISSVMDPSRENNLALLTTLKRSHGR